MDDPLAAWRKAVADHAKTRRTRRRERKQAQPQAGMVRRAAPRTVISDICLYGDCDCTMPGCACECHDGGCDHDHGGSSREVAR